MTVLRGLMLTVMDMDYLPPEFTHTNPHIKTELCIVIDTHNTRQTNSSRLLTVN